jgi:uncharacterized membrane protein
LDSIDLLRGLVMVVMALDHVRGYFSDATFDPADLSRTTPALFLTRWVTHFCAPVFVFLAGTGAYLYGTHGKTRNQVAWFLLTRGLWIVFLELTVVRFTWTFDVNYQITVLQIIWVIGWSMVVLAALVFLPTEYVAIFGIVMIALHNLFDGIPADGLGSWGWLWRILHTGGPMMPIPDRLVFAAYPLIPWIGVMAVGYAFGAVMHGDPAARRRRLLVLGTLVCLAFLLLRASNVYGDPRRWSVQTDPLFTVFSFLNCHKYPPSLLFLLMTLGPAIVFLGLGEGKPGPVGRFLITYGRVPMFFYILHFALIHGAALASSYLRASHDFGPWHPPLAYPFPWYRYTLPEVYLIWLGVVLVLYLPCRWYAGVKRRRKDWWLSYL